MEVDVAVTLREERKNERKSYGRWEGDEAYGERLMRCATREGCDEHERKRGVSHEIVPRGEREMAKRGGETREEDGAHNREEAVVSPARN
jgi:hypothetical protein